MRGSLALAALALTVAVASPAAAKDFRPGDIRLCGADRCVPVRDTAALGALARFYYASGRPRPVGRPASGVVLLQLRFANGYVTGVVAGRRLDRFLSYGVNLDRFFGGTWYRVPRPAAATLRRLGAGLRPFWLTPAALARSR